MEYNGGSTVAMAGKNCVAIASDRRFGVQALTVSTDFRKVFKVHDKLMYGLAGLGSDVQTVSEIVRFKTNMYKLREERNISPRAFGHLISSTLYEKRFGPYYIEPVIAGLDKNNTPYVAGTDLIGCLNFAEDFIVAGTSSNQLFGMCESLWEPDLEPEDLFETISQSMLNAADRDCLTGWGAIVHVITPESITTRTLKGRMD